MYYAVGYILTQQGSLRTCMITLGSIENKVWVSLSQILYNNCVCGTTHFLCVMSY